MHIGPRHASQSHQKTSSTCSAPIVPNPYSTLLRSSTYCNPADPQTDPQSVSVTPQSLSTMVVECKILSDNNPKKAKIRLGYALQLLN